MHLCSCEINTEDFSGSFLINICFARSVRNIFIILVMLESCLWPMAFTALYCYCLCTLCLRYFCFTLICCRVIWCEYFTNIWVKKWEPDFLKSLYKDETQSVICSCLKNHSDDVTLLLMQLDCICMLQFCIFTCLWILLSIFKTPLYIKHHFVCTVLVMLLCIMKINHLIQ